MRQPLSVADAVSECVNKFGLPTVIVNNAAGNFISPTERLSHNAWKTIIDIVLNGTANVTFDIGKRLITAKQGGCTDSYTLLGGQQVHTLQIPACKS